jgi:2-polyprenyl-3-methyl-5-hydroxy-6-metoxy-1,4-benzoquinol methylase
MYRFPDYILKEILSKTRGKVLDIGTGNGLKLKKILEKINKNQIEKVVALEINKTLFQVAKEVLNYDFIDVINCSFEDFHTDEKYDTIFAFEVIEHVQNPYLFLEKCRDLLNEQGCLIITTPNKRIYLFQEKFYSLVYKLFYREENKTYISKLDDVGQAHVKEFDYKEFSLILKQFFDRVNLYAIYPFHSLRSKLYEKINEITNFLPFSIRVLAVCRR